MTRQKQQKQRRIDSRFGIVFTERLEEGRYRATNAKGEVLGYIHRQGASYRADGCNGKFSGIGEAAVAMLAKAGEHA